MKVVILLLLLSFCKLEIKGNIVSKTQNCQSEELLEKEMVSYSYKHRFSDLEINNPSIKPKDIRQALLCTGIYKDVIEGKEIIGSHIEFIYDQQIDIATGNARLISSLTLFLLPTAAEAEIIIIGNLYKNGKLIKKYNSKVIVEEKYSISYFSAPSNLVTVRNNGIEKGINDIISQIKSETMKSH